MKTTIIDILNKIANNEEPPKKIKYHGYIFIYQENHYDYKGENGVWLCDSYVISAILNDEVEILETTITYKPDKIEKLEDSYKLLEKGITGWTINEGILKDKINEIIDRWNNDNR